MLTKEKVLPVLHALMTCHDQVKWGSGDNWCDLEFYITRHTWVFAFSFDEDGTMIPGGSSTVSLKDLPLHAAALNRAVAIIAALELKLQR